MIKKISGQIVDVIKGKIFPGEIVFDEKVKGKKHFKVKRIKNQEEIMSSDQQKNNENSGKIIEIKKLKKADNVLIMPGLIDAHIHIESSMLVPSRFAEIAVTHGTVATVSDPHEIANVLGEAGVEYMVREGKRTPFKFFWTAPSCVPATEFETNGHKIGPEIIEKWLKRPNFVGLSEVMNFPGVIKAEKEIMKKIDWAKKYQKVIDGHAPLLSGDNLKKYVEAGISTDHECISQEEGKEKIKLGMKIWLREGSAAKNLAALLPLVKKYPNQCGLCSDDLHPHDLLKGHINLLVKRLLAAKIDPITAIRLASSNIAKHYQLPIGLLRENDRADFIVVDGWQDFNILQTWLGGELVAQNGQSLIKPRPRRIKNNFKVKVKHRKDVGVKFAPTKSDKQNLEEKIEVNVIEAIDGQLITNKIIAQLPIDNQKNILTDIDQDILKIAVVDRYGQNHIQVGFIKNIGLKQGAIASSVAHDAHNIVAIGTNDTDLVAAINEIIKIRGGVLVVNKKKVHNRINLNIAGLMSTRHGKIIAKKYRKLKKNAKKMGSQLTDPFMTMSFMALTVIPEIKISDRGLFDVEEWKFISQIK